MDDDFIWVRSGAREILVKRSTLEEAEKRAATPRMPSVHGSRRLTAAERWAAHLQTGVHVETTGELDATLRSLGARRIEPGDKVSQALAKARQENPDNARKLDEAKKAGKVPFSS